MTIPNPPALVGSLLVGVMLAAGADAQPIQDDVVGIAITGEVTAVDTGAKTLTVKGANGEAGVFHIDEKATTIMSGNQKVGLAALHEGEWITVNADTRNDRKVATYIEVVEDPRGGGKASPAETTASGATVDVGHNKLSPTLVQIRAGQSVTFHNLDAMPGGHTVEASDGSFSSPALAKGESWSHSFDVPGIYPVRIKQHPAAEASIVVEAAD